MPDRRTFLKGAAMTAPLLALSDSGRGQSSFPTQPFYTSGTLQLVAFSDAIAGTPSSKAFSNQASSILGVRNVWTPYNLDAAVKAAMPQVTEAMLYPTPKVNMQAIYNLYKPYAPQLTLLGLAEAVQALVRDGINNGMVSQVMYNLRQIGLTSYINMAINESNSLATQSTFPRPPSMNMLPKPIPYNNGSDVPTTGSNPGCTYDGASIFGVGIALTVITVMSGGFGLGILAGAAWDAVAWWGGVGMGGWSIMHAMKCGF